MVYLAEIRRGLESSNQRSGLVQSCNEAAQSTALIENRTVILMAAIDPEVLAWRPLLQGMGLTVLNGFHHEGMGDHPVILISDSLLRKSDWPRQARSIRRQFPGFVLCVLSDSMHRAGRNSAVRAGDWDDARMMLLIAGINFFTLEEPEHVGDI
jgi:hypothetical protein